MISSPEQQQEQTFPRHPMAHPNGGMTMTDESNLVSKAVKDILGQVAKKMAKGQFGDLLKTPSPAYMHYPRTYLEGNAADLNLCSVFLSKAA